MCGPDYMLVDGKCAKGVEGAVEGCNQADDKNCYSCSPSTVATVEALEIPTKVVTSRLLQGPSTTNPAAIYPPALLSKFKVTSCGSGLNNVDGCSKSQWIDEDYQDCYECKTGYSPISSLGRMSCLSISESKLVANCYQYDKDSKCIQCVKEYLLDSGNCDNKAPSDMKDQFTNCAIKAADGSCSQCQEGSWALGYDDSLKS